ncbi:hypothetical protein GCM10018952_25760 [Streptosporangium vulgare]
MFTASTTWGDAEEPGDGGVPPGLRDDAVAGVDDDEHKLGGRGAGDHVAGVLHVAGRVGEDEAPARGGEVAVRDVDGDSLLALGAQAVREQREVGGLPALFPRGRLHRLQLVGEDRFRVVQQPADEGGLPVVHGPGGGEAQQCGGHQK